METLEHVITVEPGDTLESVLAQVASPLAGAVVLFLGTTRELTGMAQGLASQMDVYLDGLLSTSRAIAALPEIVGMEPARQEALLKELFHHYHAFARLSTFDRTGQRLASSRPGGVQSIAPREAFQTAVQHGHQTWQVARTFSAGRPVLIIDTPIRSLTLLSG